MTFTSGMNRRCFSDIKKEKKTTTRSTIHRSTGKRRGRKTMTQIISKSKRMGNKKIKEITKRKNRMS